nr:MAG TPA: hypothetical protein [Caudoviricetes sp.]
MFHDYFLNILSFVLVIFLDFHNNIFDCIHELYLFSLYILF